MSQGERPPFLDKRLGERVARDASADMRLRVEKMLGLNVPLPAASSGEVVPVAESATPVPVAGDEVHTRSTWRTVPSTKLPELASQGDQGGQTLGGRRRGNKAKTVVSVPAPEVEKEAGPVAAAIDGAPVFGAPNDTAAVSPENAEQYEISEGDVWKKIAGDDVEWLIVGGFEGKEHVATRSYDNRGGGSHGSSGIKDLIRQLRDEGYFRSSKDDVLNPLETGGVEMQSSNQKKLGKFLSLGVDQEALYRGNKGELVIVEHASNGYRLIVDNEIVGEGYDNEHIQNIAEEENWLFLSQGVLNPRRELEGAPLAIGIPIASQDDPSPELKKDVGGYEFRVLKNGEEQQYLAGDDTLFIVRKQKDGYYFVDGDGELSGPVTQDVMRHQAEAEGWRMIEREVIPKEETMLEASSEAKPAPAAAEVKGGDAEKMDLQQEIDALKTEVAEFRYKYAEMDYEKTSAWKTLKGFFRNITPKGQEDADTQYWNSEYRLKLAELQEKELEQIKRSGLKGEALKERMAGVLQYYKYEQAVELYKDRTQVRMDRQSLIGKAWGKWEQAVKAYGKLSLSKKVLIGIGLAGFSVATGGAGAVGVLLMRKAMSVTGLAMSTDALLEGLIDKKSQEKARKEIEQFQEKNFDANDSDLTFQKYASQVSFEIERLNKRFQNKKLLALVRKELSLGVGALGVLGGSLAAQAMGEHLGTHSGATAASSSAGAAPMPDRAPSAPVSGEGGPAIGSVPSDEVATARAAAGADVQGFKVEFDRYQVTDADGKRGLWGILEQHLPEDMLPQTEKNRIIQSLENIIQQKLDHMSAVELKEVGFPKGNVGQIYAGTEIDLGKLLTPDEIQAVMEGKNITLSSVETPSHVGGEHLALSPVPETAPPVAPQGAVLEQPTAPQPSSIKPAPVSDTHRSEMLVQENIPTDPLAYLREHPEALGRYNSTLGRLRMGIFMMNPGEAGVPMEYDYTLNGEKLGSTQISQVLKDLKGFDRGFLQNLDYDRVKNPLHYDQMRELGKFIEASKKAFGPKFASAEVGESIDHYTRRMAMVALQTGKEIKGFYKP